MKNHDPWEEWMDKLKYPIPRDELLDRGLAPLIKVMNIPGKILTEQSCLHGDPAIFFMVEDEKWFLSILLPRILDLNKEQYRFNIHKIYDGHGDIELFRQRDKYHNLHYWMIKSRQTGKWKFLKILTEVFSEIGGSTCVSK